MCCGCEEFIDLLWHHVGELCCQLCNHPLKQNASSIPHKRYAGRPFCILVSMKLIWCVSKGANQSTLSSNKPLFVVFWVFFVVVVVVCFILDRSKRCSGNFYQISVPFWKNNLNMVKVFVNKSKQQQRRTAGNIEINCLGFNPLIYSTGVAVPTLSADDMNNCARCDPPLIASFFITLANWCFTFSRVVRSPRRSFVMGSSALRHSCYHLDAIAILMVTCRHTLLAGGVFECSKNSRKKVSGQVEPNASVQNVRTTGQYK